MKTEPLLTPAPWDQAAFGIPAWELSGYTPAALAEADRTPGLQTIKVDPLADKRSLQQHGFYYTDTLLETRAQPRQLRSLLIPEQLSIGRQFDPVRALSICHGAFVHGRFHRDFQITRAAADLRYDNWLQQLINAQQVFGLYSSGVLAGFIGYHGDLLVLHAIAPEFRGQGLSKYWWRLVIDQLIADGCAQVRSSISAANLAVLNLYASLGFSFHHPQDVYHRIVK